MSTEIAIQQKNIMVTVSPLVPDNIMQAWAVWNGNRFTFISDSNIRKTKYDFNFSQLNPESTEAQITEALDTAKKLFQETQDERKAVTDPLDKAKAKLMEHEQNMQPIASGVKSDKVNAEYAKWDKRRIELALQREENERKAELLRNEKVKFKAHYQNEYVRIEAKYKQDLADVLNKEYIGALKAKMNADALPGYISKVKEVLAEIKPDPIAKFPRNKEQFPDADAKAIFDAIEAPGYNAHLLAAYDEVDARFSTYLTDVQHAAAVEVETKRKAEEQKKAQEQAVAATQAVNTLVANASQAVSVVSEGKAIKRKEVIVMENTQAYAMKVCMEFWKNINSVSGSLRTKEWGNLSIAQMATALSMLETKIEGLKYQEVLK